MKWGTPFPYPTPNPTPGTGADDEASKLLLQVEPAAAAPAAAAPAASPVAAGSGAFAGSNHSVRAPRASQPMSWTFLPALTSLPHLTGHRAFVHATLALTRHYRDILGW